MWPKSITDPTPADAWYIELMSNLIFYRNEVSIRQEDMAKILDVTRPQVANIEAVRSKITARQIDLWCKACGVTIKEVWPCT